MDNPSTIYLLPPCFGEDGVRPWCEDHEACAAPDPDCPYCDGQAGLAPQAYLRADWYEQLQAERERLLEYAAQLGLEYLSASVDTMPPSVSAAYHALPLPVQDALDTREEQLRQAGEARDGD